MANEKTISDNIRMRVSGDQWPELVGLSFDGNDLTLSLYVVDTISWFKGHFPDQAVLPGVVQIHWATQLAKIAFSDFVERTPCFQAVNSVKFKSMILPRQTVDLVLQYDKAKSAVKFSYRAVDDNFSTGTIIFSTL